MYLLKLYTVKVLDDSHVYSVLVPLILVVDIAQFVLVDLVTLG